MTEKRFYIKNERIIKDNKKYITENGYVLSYKNDAEELCDLLNSLVEENEQLQQRNDRQAKQLDRLYSLIEEKDWKALSDILDDFKRCEEQLQRESGTYGDVE